MAWSPIFNQHPRDTYNEFRRLASYLNGVAGDSSLLLLDPSDPPADGDTIIYTASTGLWNPTPPSGGGGDTNEVVSILVSDPLGSAITTGDEKAYYRVPDTLDGMTLSKVAAHVSTVSSSGLPTVQIRNVTTGNDMLVTKLSIDASEKDSVTAATAAVINPSFALVSTADELAIDIDVAGTGAKGLAVELQFSATPPPAFAVIIDDQFTGVSIDMGGRTPSPISAGHNWVEQKRNWAVVSNVCEMTESADGQLVVDSGIGNCTVEVDLLHVGGQPSTDGGLLVRNIAINDSLYAFLAYNATPQKLQLYDYVNGSVASYTTGTINDDQWYRLKVVMLNDNIKVFLDGVQRIDYTLSGGEYTRFPATNTSHGFSSGNGAAWIFDNFLVTT